MTAIEDARAVEVRTNERGREPWAISLTTEIGPNGYTDTLRMTEAEAREVYRALGERLTAPPTDDERDALIALLTEMTWGAGRLAHGPSGRIADHLLAAGFRRQGPITDAQVEAADAAWWAHPDISGGLDCMRAALEAARDA